MLKGGDTVKRLNAGLPNVAGRLRYEKNGYGSEVQEQSGALSVTTGTGYAEAGGTAGNNLNATIIFDANKSNSIFGASNTVQPPAMVLIPQIKY